MTIDARKQIISQLLMLHPDCRPDSGAVADRSLWLWKRIALNLTPLIGEVGFQALYARAVYLALPECPGFALARHESSTTDLFQELKAGLVALEYGLAEQCSNILLTKFTDLVASMIGDALMEQILRSAWDESSSRANKGRL
jgi:hypothetical protein